MALSSHVLLAIGLGSCSVGAAALGHALARVLPLERPALGRRGLERSLALQRSAVFALFEPCLRYCGALVARCPLGAWRMRLERALTHAGDPFGLGADEMLALAVACGAGAAWLASASGLRVGPDSGVPLLAAALACGWPLAHLQGAIARRRRRIEHQLPLMIDLLSLCMGAGFDFAGALELVTRELRDPRAPLVVECTRLLSELALGRTRAQALSVLGERVPTEAVRGFVSAVIQAEHSGTPLADVLLVQARALRLTRSVAAEEAAARASVLLVLPMMLLAAAVVLLMVGAFVVHGFGF